MPTDPRRDDNEAELRIRRQSGEAPGPGAAHQEERRDNASDDRRGRAKDGAAEPAPGEANPLSDPRQRPNDRREREP